jgi:hypothetical protein
MNYRMLAKVAKTVVDKRGGTDALKADFEQLQQIAKGEGSVGTKAGKAAAALRTPGGARVKATPDAPAPDAPGAAGDPADGPTTAGPA